MSKDLTGCETFSTEICSNCLLHCAGIMTDTVFERNCFRWYSAADGFRRQNEDFRITVFLIFFRISEDYCGTFSAEICSNCLLHCAGILTDTVFEKNFSVISGGRRFALRIARIFQDSVHTWSQRLLPGGLLERTQVQHLCCKEIRTNFATQLVVNFALEIFRSQNENFRVTVF